MNNIIFIIYYLYSIGIATFITVVGILLDNNTKETMLFQMMAAFGIIWISLTVGVGEYVFSKLRKEKRNVRIYR